MIVKPVTSYMTSDGKIFKHQSDATFHEKFIQLEKILCNVLNGRYTEYAMYDVIKAVANNHELINSTLNKVEIEK